jgi:hypothetical protein
MKNLFFASNFLVLLVPNLTEEAQCFVDGECTESLIVDTLPSVHEILISVIEKKLPGAKIINNYVT